MAGSLELVRWLQTGGQAVIHDVALSAGGVYVLAGSEQGLRLFDNNGHERFHLYQKGRTEMPFHQVAVTPDMESVLAATRQGTLYRVELESHGRDYIPWPEEIYLAQNDIHDLALSVDGEYVALGHLGPALSVFDATGHLQWRRHPDDGNPTEGKTWAVAFDGEGSHLWVGCSGAPRAVLAALETSSGRSLALKRFEARITAVACTTQPARVAAILTDGQDGHRIVCYSPELGEACWDQAFEESITALAGGSEGRVLAVGSGYGGRLVLVDAQTGQLLGEHPSLGSVIHCLAVVDDRYVVAGTQDGSLAYLRYLEEGRL